VPVNRGLFVGCFHIDQEKGFGEVHHHTTHHARKKNETTIPNKEFHMLWKSNPTISDVLPHTSMSTPSISRKFNSPYLVPTTLSPKRIPFRGIGPKPIP
jgi:hypothetical protein